MNAYEIKLLATIKANPLSEQAQAYRLGRKSVVEELKGYLQTISYFEVKS